MKKGILYILLILFLISCSPPRIIYSIDDVIPMSSNDSIEILLVKGSLISTGTTELYPNLYLRMVNNKKNTVSIGQKPILILKTDSVTLTFEILSDTIIYKLKSNSEKSFHLSFKAKDLNHVAYTTVEWPSIWAFGTHKLETPQHKLYLYLDLFDNEGNRMRKCIILEPIGTKRMKYEKPPF